VTEFGKFVVTCGEDMLGAVVGFSLELHWEVQLEPLSERKSLSHSIGSQNRRFINGLLGIKNATGAEVGFGKE